MTFVSKPGRLFDLKISKIHENFYLKFWQFKVFQKRMLSNVHKRTKDPSTLEHGVISLHPQFYMKSIIQVT